MRRERQGERLQGPGAGALLRRVVRSSLVSCGRCGSRLAEEWSEDSCLLRRMNNITIYDSLKVPDVAPGEYVLGFRWCARLSRAETRRGCANIVVAAGTASPPPRCGSR